MSAVRQSFEAFVSDQAMLSLEPENTRQQRSQQLYQDHQQLQHDLFDYILTSRLWKDSLANAFEDILLSPTIDTIDHQLMFAEKSWGSYRVLDIEERSMTVKVTLNPGHKMNYHSHDRRDELWNVIAGSGMTIVEGIQRFVKAGDSISMPAGCKHTVIAGEKGIQLIEVQIGEDITVTDKHKFEMP